MFKIRVYRAMKKHNIIMTIAAFFIFTGCGSRSGPDLSPEASKKALKSVPDWYIMTPDKEGYSYGTGEGTSQSMQLAVDKARVTAVSELSQLIKSEWSGRFWTFSDLFGRFCGYV